MAAQISFHFDGPVIENHQISLRILGNTLIGLQGAIDRAYIDVERGDVWKYARLKSTDYPRTDFIVGQPRDGGYILDVIREGGERLVKRVYQAIDAVNDAPWNEGVGEVRRLAERVAIRRQQLDQAIYRGRTLAEFVAEPGEQVVRRYADRSIAKEVDQILAPIRRGPRDGQEGENTLELTFDFGARHRYSFEFGNEEASRFHDVVSARDLGEPLVYEGLLRALDRGNRYSRPKAKLTMTHNNRDVVVHVGSEREYQELAPHMQGSETVRIVACPIVEFGSFDPNAGDIFFVRMA